MYGGGHSESLIGRFLKTLPAGRTQGLFVASKLGRLKGFPDGYSESLFRECTKESVERLGRVIDLHQLHCVPPEALRRGRVFDWLRKLKSEGLIRHFGASVESMEEARICLQQDDLDALQIIFNIFRQKPIDELFAEAREKGVALIVRLPLASGLLAGKYTKQTTFPEKDHRNYNRDGKFFNVGETFAGLPFEKAVELTERIKPLLGIAPGAADQPAGATMADLAMRWILDHDAVTTVIPGATKPAQAQSNVHASDLPPLPPRVHAALRDFYAARSEGTYTRGILNAHGQRMRQGGAQAVPWPKRSDDTRQNHFWRLRRRSSRSVPNPSNAKLAGSGTSWAEGPPSSGFGELDAGAGLSVTLVIPTWLYHTGQVGEVHVAVVVQVTDRHRIGPDPRCCSTRWSGRIGPQSRRGSRRPSTLRSRMTELLSTGKPPKLVLGGRLLAVRYALRSLLAATTRA